MEQITSELINLTLNDNDLKYIQNLENKLEKALGIEFDDNSYDLFVKIKIFAFKKGINAGLHLNEYLNKNKIEE